MSRCIAAAEGLFSRGRTEATLPDGSCRRAGEERPTVVVLMYESEAWAILFGS